ncbi:phosphatidylglycerophosphatase [Burkholderia cepacia]|uniref:Phosphatidylglycerophosphatase A n=1 Tax=Burkholderia cepacia TaxID=292 RepID=A0A104AT40_BURCE|nr:phosphatidylglycerophosphatase A [Burkholderia cepacia]AOK15674.1 phosphatidylglycerophosphatase [Burkholderia cepacia]KVH30418.1 phosphatidylglycerophosphatase [Burkholderia cepacia]KVK86695.1 phosphatidylglycerophosphatase [Burkholderia cepacia]KVL03962.1 phosphatidylglycerophosphatase [Burkholderia cepacia]KVL53175.1 phosphatidylglycerophosphatase [Burkholderia cepacia]
MQTDPTPAHAAAEPGAAPGGHTPRRATARFMLSHPAHLVSLGFGSGLAPLMPGTFGSLFGWLTFVVLNRYLTVPEWWALIAVGFAAGTWLTGFTARKMGTSDPGAVVWDEIVAIWLVMLFVTPATFVGQLWAFVAFRIFDMLKPPPIRYVERRLKGGLGIMVDDLVAAFMTLLVIALWRSVAG